jgi:hypothetical protein
MLMNVIEVMNQGRNSLGRTDAIYEECSMMCRSFTAIVLFHGPREENMAAHLARHSEGEVSVV